MELLTQVLHGLVVKKHGRAKDIAALIIESEDRVSGILKQAESHGRVVEFANGYTLSPLGRIALESEYSLACVSIRESKEFFDAYESFEIVNTTLKKVITDWQIITVGGERVTNDHSNDEYDMKIIDQLGGLHDKVEGILLKMEHVLPRMRYYRENLLKALERAEDGDVEWVSDAKISSYHTLWFELHEDLLRMLGQTRKE